MKLIFKKTFGVLTPIDEIGERFMARIRDGDMVTVEARRPRNIKRHNCWWAMCAFIAQHTSQLPTAEHASKYLLIRTGRCTWVRGKGGDVPIADSISFANMDNDAFEEMYSDALDLICVMLPHIKRDDVARVLAEFAGVGSLMSDHASAAE